MLIVQEWDSYECAYGERLKSMWKSQHKIICK